MFIYSFCNRLREQGRGAEKEGEGESQAGSALSVWCPKWDSESLNVRSWPELKPRVRYLTCWATQVPIYFSILMPILNYPNWNLISMSWNNIRWVLYVTLLFHDVFGYFRSLVFLWKFYHNCLFWQKKN